MASNGNSVMEYGRERKSLSRRGKSSHWKLERKHRVLPALDWHQWLDGVGECVEVRRTQNTWGHAWGCMVTTHTLDFKPHVDSDFLLLDKAHGKECRESLIFTILVVNWTLGKQKILCPTDNLSFLHYCQYLELLKFQFVFEIKEFSCFDQ